MRQRRIRESPAISTNCPSLLERTLRFAGKRSSVRVRYRPPLGDSPRFDPCPDETEDPACIASSSRGSAFCFGVSTLADPHRGHAAGHGTCGYRRRRVGRGISRARHQSRGVATAVTPFANEWDEPFRTGTRVVTGLAFLVVAFLLIVFTFTTITLIVGAPFYEKIWRHVEQRYGVVPDEGVQGFGARLARAWETASECCSQRFCWVCRCSCWVHSRRRPDSRPGAGCVVRGWVIAVELVGMAFDARGKTLKQTSRCPQDVPPDDVRFRRCDRPGFPVPGGAVLVMPAAVAGATMLARRELGEPTETSPVQLESA